MSLQTPQRLPQRNLQLLESVRMLFRRRGCLPSRAFSQACASSRYCLKNRQRLSKIYRVAHPFDFLEFGFAQLRHQFGLAHGIGLAGEAGAKLRGAGSAAAWPAPVAAALPAAIAIAIRSSGISRNSSATSFLQFARQAFARAPSLRSTCRCSDPCSTAETSCTHRAPGQLSQFIVTGGAHKPAARRQVLSVSTTRRGHQRRRIILIQILRGHQIAQHVVGGRVHLEGDDQFPHRVG